MMRCLVNLVLVLGIILGSHFVKAEAGGTAIPSIESHAQAFATTQPATPNLQPATSSQQPDSFLIADVILLGQKKTRPRVIYREMTFGRGDRIAAADFEAEIAETYAALMNTGLFASVDINYSDTLLQPGQQIVYLHIRETWYIYPVPEFSLADRNFNVWWRDQGRSLDRVNLGGKLTYYNFTGRRDRLKVGFTTGYTREYEASYNLPYLNRAGSVGMGVDFSVLQRREQNYNTANNEQLFFEDQSQFVYRRTRVNLSMSFRRKLYVSHRLILGYRNSSIADTVAQVLNPEFFGGGRSSQEFLRLEYRYRNDRRDVRNYPWKGHFLEATVAKDGLGITGQRSGFTLGATYRQFWPLNDKYSLNFGLGAKYSLIRTRQPFLENRAIGFGSNGLVGYQFYVVDGLDMLIWRFGVRRQLFKTDLDLGKMVFIDAFRYIPIRVLLSFQFNQGFSNSPFAEMANPLNNRLLTGTSLGVDVVLFYDMVASVQYNHNHLGEGGVFLALRLNF
jgi:hypothetical protein